MCSPLLDKVNTLEHKRGLTVYTTTVKLQGDDYVLVLTEKGSNPLTVLKAQSMKALRKHYDIQSEVDAQERFLTSLHRTKRTMLDYLVNNLNSTSYFLTLTYADNVEDYDVAQKDFKRFIRSMGDISYMATKERQERGAIHFHVVVFDKITDEDVRLKWTHGFVHVKHIKRIDEPLRIANYFTSYLTKMKEDNPLIAQKKKLVFTSRGLKKTEKVKGGFVKQLLLENTKTCERIESYRTKYQGMKTIYRFTVDEVEKMMYS